MRAWSALEGRGRQHPLEFESDALDLDRDTHGTHWVMTIAPPTIAEPRPAQVMNPRASDDARADELGVRVSPDEDKTVIGTESKCSQSAAYVFARSGSTCPADASTVHVAGEEEQRRVDRDCTECDEGDDFRPRIVEGGAVDQNIVGDGG